MHESVLDLYPGSSYPGEVPEHTLEHQVQAAYSRIALEPGQNRLFPTGRPLAEGLGYPASALDALPEQAVEAFCGVAYLLEAAEPRADEVVLDLGCGSGVDSLLCAERAGHVLAVDANPEMLERARQAVTKRGWATRITLLRARAQQLPLLDASVHGALVNGMFNLQTEGERRALFAELARVIAPGGRLIAGELILSGSGPPPSVTSDNWFA